jgi:hypothetical protein
VGSARRRRLGPDEILELMMGGALALAREAVSDPRISRAALAMM